MFRPNSLVAKREIWRVLSEPLQPAALIKASEGKSLQHKSEIDGVRYQQSFFFPNNQFQNKEI